jgi:adenylate cyclase
MDFGYCPKCGTALAAVSPPDVGVRATATGITKAPGWAADAEADRRPVTVLFADLCGFTSLSERLDPEQVLALQRDLFGELTKSVQSYGGHVDKVMGDGLLALFGAPVAHENDAEQALNCALALGVRTAEVGRRWKDLSAPLALHIGVNTGPVAAGAVGLAGSESYSVTGDTVNSASRLQGLAEPGQILVGPATYRLTRHAFSFEPLGRLALRGRAGALEAYLLGKALETPRPARGLETLGLNAPMIGRELELDTVMAAFERVRTGPAQVVRLVGEAGAGKSRLVAAFLEKLRAQGHLDRVTLRRAAVSPLDSRSYGVMADILRDGYGIMPNEPPEAVRERLVSGLRELDLDEEEVTRVVPVVMRLLGGADSAGALGPSDPEQVRRQIVLAFRTMLEHRLAREPVLLVIEDLHWADAASLDLLRLMADRLASHHLMLLFTHRPEFEAAAIVTSQAAQTVLRLSPLNEANSAALFDALFGVSAARLPASLRRLVVERASGNPLHLEEIVRGLVEDGVLVREANGWRAEKERAAMSIPLGLQGLLLARLDRLPPETRRVVQEAAVLGAIFDSHLLKRVSATPAAIEDALDLLLDAEYLEELPRGAGGAGTRCFRFRQSMVREVIYENMLLRRRTGLHRAVGEALEQLTKDEPRRPEDLESLGRHFGLGGEAQRGAGYLVQAGDWARNVYANEDALKRYRGALELLEIAPEAEAERLAIRERIADLLGPSGQRGEAFAHYEAAYAAHAARGDRPAQARLCRKIASLHWETGERERALERCRAGLALIEDGPRHIEVAHQFEEMGRVTFRMGDFTDAARWAERALTYVENMIAEGVPRRNGAPDPGWRREAAQIVSHAHNTLGVALARQRRASEAVACVERSVSVAEDHGLLDAALRGYSNLGVLYSTLEPKRAIDSCRKGLEVARKIGDLGFEARLYANLAVACCTFTDRCNDEGLAAAERALDLDRRLDLRDHLAVPLTVLAQIHQCHGDPGEALRYYSEALEVASEIGEAQLLFPCYEGLAVLHLDKGDEARAEDFFRKAQGVCEQAGVEPDALVVLPFLA